MANIGIDASADGTDYSWTTLVNTTSSNASGGNYVIHEDPSAFNVTFHSPDFEKLKAQLVAKYVPPIPYHVAGIEVSGSGYQQSHPLHLEPGSVSLAAPDPGVERQVKRYATTPVSQLPADLAAKINVLGKFHGTSTTVMLQVIRDYVLMEKAEWDSRLLPPCTKSG